MPKIKSFNLKYMNTLNRSAAPEIQTIKKLDVIQPAKYILSNGIPVYAINAGTQDIIKIEFIFCAGTFYQQNKLVAQFTNKMLIEGTKKKSANEIADTIDFYGAFIQTDVEKDKAYITLYCLNKHLSNVLPTFEDIIKNATFPVNEFSIYLQNQKQQYIVNSQKVNYVARTKFPCLIFGNNNPYGVCADIDDYNNLQRQSLIDFYKSYYKANKCKIIIAGKINHEHHNLLETYFGKNDWLSNEKIENKNFTIETLPQKKHFIYKEDALQSAIRIGKSIVNKTHPDYMGLQVLNTVLGGYFGSRLMTNIREDKGYTYGIGSGLISFINSGLFFIASEVGTDVCSKAVDEIYKELKLLRTLLISESELNLVKNYLLGTLLRNADGPFALSDRYRGLLEYGLDETYYTAFVETINNITPTTLKELAEKYFSEESMFELIVGKIDK